jgi:hypothetical protein
VYQHSGRRKKNTGAQQGTKRNAKREEAQYRLNKLCERFPYAFAVWSGEVTMFYVSRSSSRLEELLRIIEKSLGPCGSRGEERLRRLLLGNTNGKS